MIRVPVSPQAVTRHKSCGVVLPPVCILDSLTMNVTIELSVLLFCQVVWSAYAAATNQISHMQDQATNNTALDQENGVQGDEEMADGDARFSPLHAAGIAAIATVGEGNDEGGRQVLQQPEVEPSDETPDAAAADMSGVVGGPAEAEEAGKAAGAHELLEAGTAAVASGDARGSAASDAQAQVSFADAEGGLASISNTRDDGQGSAQVDARAKAAQIDKEFDAMLGERSYQEKRDTINFLADPTTRPVNPRLPVLSAEEKQSILRGGRSAKTWNKSYMMKTDYEGASCDLADERIRARERNDSRRGTDEDWRSAPSSEWVGLVPFMKRRAQQPVVRGGPKTGSESGFVVVNDDSLHRLRVATRPGYDGDELTSMVVRRDDQERDATIARRPLPGASPAATPYPGTSTSLVRTVAGTLSRTPKPARGGGLGGRALRDRRGSSGSVLRYRSQDRRQSLAGEQRYGAGTLGQWLGETGNQPSPSPADVNDARRDDSYGASLVQRGGASKRRGVGQDPPTADGPQGQASGAPAAGNKRAAASLGLGGMDATPRRKTVMEEAITEEGQNLVRRVEAEAKATAEVGSILMSVVSQENKTRDVSRQVREEQALRTSKRDEQQRASSGQVRESDDADTVFS